VLAGRLDASGCLSGHGGEGGLPGDVRKGSQVERLHDRALVAGPDHYVARQQQPDRAIGTECLVREWWVAGAEDEVVLHVFAELVANGGADVDLGEHPEFVFFQCLPDPGDRVGEGGAVWTVIP